MNKKNNVYAAAENDQNELLLSIVIINYRTANMVIDCLTSILSQIDINTMRVVVVDNASNDNSAQLISEWIDKTKTDGFIKLLCSEKNLGFSGGNNYGITRTNAKYYLLLNSDTLLRKDAITNLLQATDKYKNAGLFTPRLEWPDGSPQESCFRFLTPVSELISSAQTGIITKLFTRYVVAIPITKKVTKPEWSSFACVLIKKQVFEDVGLMDDEYFMYFEDVVFCYRAKNAGWAIVNCPASRVVHLRGGSSPVKENSKLNKRLPKYFYESRTRYYYEVYGWFGLTSSNILWTVGRVISKCRQLLGRSDKSVSNKQWRDIWTNWYEPFKRYTHPDNYKEK